MTRHATFVQVGATRDGLETYLDCARTRGMRAVLVETPAYLAWRARLGRRQFDAEIPVADPQHPGAVRAALSTAGVTVGLVLTGFERYVGCGFALAHELAVPPWPSCGAGFTPVDKRGQRALLTAAAPAVRQPRYLTIGPDREVPATERLGYPQVVKPTDGGGGLEVTLVEDAAQRAAALARIGATANYGGGRFAGAIIEEFVEGTEWSAQGVVVAGRPVLVAACEKIVTLEPAPGDPTACGFRETGHLAHRADAAPPALRELATSAIATLGLREGPFHVDAILTDDAAYFIEAGFRLSGGGLSRLVAKATGIDWADLVFRAHLGEPMPATTATTATAPVTGQVTATHPAELDVARSLVGDGLDVEILQLPPTPDPASIGADPSSLASDLARHTGFAGRIVIAGSERNTVRAALERCVGTRLGV
jgi:ATP-grasp domain